MKATAKTIHPRVATVGGEALLTLPWAIAARREGTKGVVKQAPPDVYLWMAVG